MLDTVEQFSEDVRELRTLIVRCMEGENAHKPGPCPTEGSEESNGRQRDTGAQRIAIENANYGNATPEQIELINDTLSRVLAPFGITLANLTVTDSHTQEMMHGASGRSMKLSKGGLEAKPLSPEEVAAAKERDLARVPLYEDAIAKKQEEAKKARGKKKRDIEREISELNDAVNQMKYSPSLFVWETAKSPAAAMVAHEAGHILDGMLGVDMAAAVRRAQDRGEYDPLDRYRVSAFGSEHPAELFAEITSALATGQQDRVPPKLRAVYNDAVKQAITNGGNGETTIHPSAKSVGADEEVSRRGMRASVRGADAGRVCHAEQCEVYGEVSSLRQTSDGSRRIRGSGGFRTNSEHRLPEENLKCDHGRNAGLPGVCPEDRAEPSADKPHPAGENPFSPDEPHAAVHQKALHAAKSLLKLAGKIPGKVYAKAKERVAGHYQKLAGRYGKKMAVAILAAGIVGTATPVPGGGLLAAAPLVATAELYVRLTGQEQQSDDPTAPEQEEDEPQIPKRRDEFVTKALVNVDESPVFLDVPVVLQERDNECGPAALESVARYFGVWPRQTKAVRVWKSGGTCKPGQTAAETGCTPASGDGGQRRESTHEEEHAERVRAAEEDWKANGVKSQAFKSWFGDWENDPENASKVVDEEGKPLVVYHGTTRSFSEFKTGTHNAWTDSLGFDTYFFAEGAAVASTYANQAEGGKVLPFYLSIKNPLVIDVNGGEWPDAIAEAVDNIRTYRTPEEKHYLEVMSAYEREYGYELEYEPDSIPEEATRAVEEASRAVQDHIQNNKELYRSAPRHPFGYDGIIVKNVLDMTAADVSDEYASGYSPYTTVHIAFKPTQIKSANNRGTFDPSTANINKSFPRRGNK